MKRESRGKGLHHWMTHAPPWDSPGTLLCHQDMEERFISHFNEIFKERILPINNHELECSCVSSWLTFLPCQAGPAVSSVKEKNKTSMVTEDAGHRERRELAHTHKGGNHWAAPHFYRQQLIPQIYISGWPEISTGFCHTFLWKNLNEPFFFLIGKRWTYLQRNTLHRVWAAQKARVTLGETLQRSTGHRRRQERP